MNLSYCVDSGLAINHLKKMQAVGKEGKQLPATERVSNSPSSSNEKPPLDGSNSVMGDM
jgi:hypothetical protein